MTMTIVQCGTSHVRKHADRTDHINPIGRPVAVSTQAAVAGMSNLAGSDRQSRPTLLGYVFSRFPGAVCACVLLFLASSVLDLAAALTLAPIAALMLHKAGATDVAGGVVERVSSVLASIGFNTDNLIALVIVFMVLNVGRNVLRLLAYNRTIHIRYKVQETIVNDAFEAVMNQAGCP